jgi:predicted Co/Zn/Cd cation transporter (cation efflux family)
LIVYYKNKIDFIFLIIIIKLNIKMVLSELEETLQIKEAERKQLRKYLAKKYYQKNKHKILNKQKEYNEKNKDKITAYRETNKEKIKEKLAEYRHNNKEKIKEYSKNYRKNNKAKIAEYRKDRTK